jgi:LPXTG-motif cell wall-anchored protein
MLADPFTSPQMRTEASGVLVFKKALATVAVAGLLVLGGAGAALADYPSDAPVTAGDTTLTVGQSTTIAANDLGDYTSVTTVPPGAGATLGSIVLASGTGSGELPATGGTGPAAFIWLGVGAIGLGGIAVAAAVARRRAARSR